MSHKGWNQVFGCQLLFAIFMLLAGCSPHNPFNVVDRTESSPVQNTFPPTYDKVFVTRNPLPPTVAFVPISRIDVGKVWYGSNYDAIDAIVERARALGANAVIEVQTWHQPDGWSWAAPHGSGEAVHITDPKSLEAAGVAGTWY
jgi:hypothetical protein